MSTQEGVIFFGKGYHKCLGNKHGTRMLSYGDPVVWEGISKRAKSVNL